MTGFNLPPGCNVSDLPGNSPEDEKFDYATEWLIDEMMKAGIDYREFKLFFETGKVAVMESRKVTEEHLQEWEANGQQAADDGYCPYCKKEVKNES